MKKIALFIAAVISTPVLAWTNDSSGTLNFGGKITPEEYSNFWRWRVGTGLNGFKHNLMDMDPELKKLTITMDSPKGLLYGETVKAMTASVGMGAIPNIVFTDSDKNTVLLEQDSSDNAGTGYITLPIKDKQNNKIGTLKLNVTAAGLGVRVNDLEGYYTRFTVQSVSAESNSHIFYGGLHNRPIQSVYTVNDLFRKFEVVATQQVLGGMVQEHPLFKDVNLSTYAVWNHARPIYFDEGYTGGRHGVAAASYVLGIDTNQTMEATFNSPLTATTNWSALLNVNVTYN